MSPIKRLIHRLRMTAQLCRVETKRALEIDWEAYVYRSEFDETPRMPPLVAVVVFTDYFMRPGYQKHRDCKRCERWDPPNRPKMSTSYRPPGTASRNACHGCAVSYLAELGEEIEAIQDRLYEEWVNAREDLKDHQAARRYQDTERDVRAWRNRRRVLQRNISEAERACELSGLAPMKRWRQWTRREGDFPNLPLEQDVVSAEIVKCEGGETEARLATWDHLTLGDKCAV